MRKGVAKSSRARAPRRCRRGSAHDDVALVGQKSRHRQRALGNDLPAVHRDDPAGDLREPLRRERHVLVAYADDDEVVRVVGDGRREGSTAEARAGEKPEPDPPGCQMPLDDGELHEVALRVGDREPVDDGRLALEQLGQDLIRDEPDRASRTALPRDRRSPWV